MFLKAQEATFAWYQFISYGGREEHDFKANWLWALKPRYQDGMEKQVFYLPVLKTTIWVGFS